MQIIKRRKKMSTLVKPTNLKSNESSITERKNVEMKVMGPCHPLASSKQDMIMHSLQKFFSELKNLGKMLPILNQTTTISLRVLDWFVTNYAKKKNVEYFINNKFYVNVYLSYKQQLKAYSKQQFDPFCRKWKKQNGKDTFHGINFYYTKDKYIETTVGQLNFFRWIISKQVLDYVIIHLKEIMADMLMTAKKGKKIGSKKKKKIKKQGLVVKVTPKLKRSSSITTKKDISLIATKKLKKKHVEITISFD